MTQAAGSVRALRDPVCADWQGRHHVLFRGEDGLIHNAHLDRVAGALEEEEDLDSERIRALLGRRQQASAPRPARPAVLP
jgi:hypothetical protein